MFRKIMIKIAALDLDLKLILFLIFHSIILKYKKIYQFL